MSNTLVHVLAFVGFSNVILPTYSTKISNFIEKQTDMCSYISLCTQASTSVYVKSFDTLRLPCCRECFCDKKCKIRGDCCPDSNITEYNVTSLHEEFESFSDKVDSTEQPATSLGCVKTHHGLYKNDEGYRMIDYCPRNFIQNDTKVRCETELDNFHVNLYDHIPISDTVTGLTFKNQFCKSCHSSNVGLFEFWKVWLVCENPVFVSYIDLTSPFDLVNKIFQSKTKMCSIVFKPGNISIQSCERENVIDKCSNRTLDTYLQNACNEYTWHIMAMDGLKLNTYKNYACMVCNGVQFRERCRYSDYQTGQHVEALLNLELSDNKTIDPPSQHPVVTNGSKLTPRDQVIQQVFKVPYVNCSTGLVYDKGRDVCRQVLCPKFLFIKNGKCTPIFGVIKGLIYRIIVEVLLPYSLNGAETKIVEPAIYSSFNNFFLQRLSKGNYAISLWGNSNSTLAITRETVYVLYLTVGDQFARGYYPSLLDFVNQLLLFHRQFPISVLIKDRLEIVSVGLKFGTSVKVLNLNTLWYIRTPEIKKSDKLQVVLPLNWKAPPGKASLFVDVTKLYFCYNVIVFEDEFRTMYGNTIELLDSKRFLHGNNFQIAIINGKKKARVCINDAIINVDERSSYAFNSTESDSILSMYEWPSRTENRNRKENNDVRNDMLIINDDNNIDKDSKSLVIIICSLASVVVFVFIRLFLKKYTKCTRNNDEVESIDDDYAENIPMSNLRTISENIGCQHHERSESVKEEAV